MFQEKRSTRAVTSQEQSQDWSPRSLFQGLQGLSPSVEWSGQSLRAQASESSPLLHGSFGVHQAHKQSSPYSDSLHSMAAAILSFKDTVSPSSILLASSSDSSFSKSFYSLKNKQNSLWYWVHIQFYHLATLHLLQPKKMKLLIKLTLYRSLTTF